MNETDWHGWGTRGTTVSLALHIGKLPGRKSVCLYIHEGSTIDTVAFFRNEEDAKRTMAVIDKLFIF